MAQRTDKFRPSVIDPTKFEFVAQHYLGPIGEDMENSGICEEMADEQHNLELHQAAHPGFTVAGHKWPGQCDCCGARYLWGSTFHTAESNTYISIGCICAGKLNLGDPAAMKSFREQVNTYKIHAERVAAARKFADANGIAAALALYLSNAKADPSLSEYDRFPHNTLVDMMGKLVRWGNISEKQVAFAVKLLAQIADQPRKLAEREAREANRKPIPAFIKRATIEGVIVSAKYQEGGENAELRKALEASHREIAEARQYWANQGPHDHVVISLAEYNKLVKQRDSAVAERDALEKELMQVCSYRAIDGKWVRTS